MKESFDLGKIRELFYEAKASCLSRQNAADIHEKGRCNFVTKADTDMQQFIRKRLKMLWPSVQFMGEEQDNSGIDIHGDFWILDPIDGTSNLIHDFHRSCVSLALCIDGAPYAGVIFDLYTEEFFYAERGKGAYANGRQIHVSPIEEAENSLICVGTSPYYKKELGTRNMDDMRKIFFTFEDIRRTGSAALDIAYTAAGRAEAFFERRLQPWDYAAGALITKESGGTAETLSGEPLSFTHAEDVLLGNGAVVKKIRELLLKG